jgi:hypothetical protein
MTPFAQALLYMLGCNALSWLAGFIMGRITAPKPPIVHRSVSDMALDQRYRAFEGAESNVVHGSWETNDAAA